VSGLYFGVRKGTVAKLIYCFGSPAVATGGASYFWIWRSCPASLGTLGERITRTIRGLMVVETIAEF